MEQSDIKSMSLEEMQCDFERQGLDKYRARQVYEWLNHYGVPSFSDMTNIPKKLKEAFKKKYYIANVNIEKKIISKYNETVKYLFKLIDGNLIESVLMKYKHGYSMCISTQVGCKMGCSFCATGRGGFERDLLPSEMIAQIQAAQRDSVVRVSNVVLMGMGEPLDNYDNVLNFLRLVSADEGMNIGIRHISLSTCGLVDKIYALAKEHLGITLSISLHAPNDHIRDKLMKINKVFNIEAVLKACDYYTDATNRRVSFEYSMISGVNDTDECAYELAERLKGKLCHVNLIQINGVEGTKYKKSNRVARFSEILLAKGLNVTLRRTLGSDINASCGQLRNRANL